MADFLFIVAAYLLGSLSFAVLVSRIYGLPDPHTYGSGNPGATNVLRTGKKSAAVLTLLGDGAKGWLAVYLVQMLGPEFGVGSVGVAGVVLAAFLGHLYPVFFRFQGGKGVATALGVLLAIDVWLGLGTLAIWLLVFAIFRISSLAALVAAALAPVYDYWLSGPRLMTIAICLMSVLLIWRHRENIRRLARGEEGGVGKTR